MKNMNDYSGTLIPDLKLSDFSRDALEKLVLMYSKLYMILDTFWYFTVMNRQGNQEAWDSECETWNQMSRYEMKKIKETLGIKGSGLIPLTKAMQLAPWFLHTKYTIDVENENSIILKVNECVTLEALEKEGKGREKDVCSILGPKLFEDYASLFSPNIKIECLTPLPRCNRNDIPCAWSFKLAE